MSTAVDVTAMQGRLAELREQYAAGERTVQELAARRHDMETALLRVSGAIQVLEELIATAAEAPPADAPQADAPAGR